MADLFDEEYDEATLAALQDALPEFAQSEAPAATPQAQDVDNGARPANAPQAVKQAAQAQQPAVKARQPAAASQDDAAMMSFRSALDEARQRRLGASIGQAADEFSSRLLGQQASPYWQRAMQEADEPVRQFQATEALRTSFEKRVADKAKALRDEAEDKSQAALRNAQITKTEQEVTEGKAKQDAQARLDDKASEESRAAREGLKLNPQTRKFAAALGAALDGMSASDIARQAELAKKLGAGDEALGWARLAQQTKEGELDRANRLEAARIGAGVKQTAADQKATEKQGILTAPGFGRVDPATGKESAPIREEEASKFREGAAEIVNIKDALDRMSQLRGETGFLGRKVLPTEEKAELQLIADGLLGAINSMEHFGALDRGTEGILKRMIPSADDFTEGTFVGKLKGLERNIKARLRNRSRILGYFPDESGPYGWVLQGGVGGAPTQPAKPATKPPPTAAPPAPAATQAAPSQKLTPGGNPYARRQVHPKTGAVRYLDEAGKVVQ